MKKLIVIILMAGITDIFGQNVQLHYDLRHTLDPAHQATNYPSVSFEYFKNIDTLGSGSFLFKMQTDFNGEHKNVSQVFVQLSQTLRFWKPKVYLSLNYTGGLGVAGGSFGYYLTNSFAVGAAYPFQWKGAWLSASVLYRYNAFVEGSHDTQLIFYFGKGLWNYKVFIAGSFVGWTENKNQGNDFTAGQHGKKFAFFGDPQIWLKIGKGFSVGSRVNVYYHVINLDNKLLVYPTIGAKYQF
jgi:hypothetical protein